ncbi:unnamed protein product [Aphanomyces euteiches]|uniref:Uncharacterized protein n=1 Tax=Aphanomyces euteiches TaxID=100861 RepID=A0A6G0W8S1_9STRA|nr:hypothetical protein Ae201684_018388 [Aphanomyces euteiches]KAH9097696.1 hypothetical protein Ae201684P_001172 [Aphanomyces euteiches]KAH9140017.1 hypothetical protein AeRB84_015742 [Aphanomyces euteiches]
MPPKRKPDIDDNAVAAPATPPPKRRAIMNAMEKNPPTPDGGIVTIQCVEVAAAFLALEPIPARAALSGKVLWTESGRFDCILVYLAPSDDASDIDDLLSATRDASYELKMKNMQHLLPSSVYDIKEGANPFTAGRIVHCKRTTGHGKYNFCGYSCNSNISQWRFDSSDN